MGTTFLALTRTQMDQGTQCGTCPGVMRRITHFRPTSLAEVLCLTGKFTRATKKQSRSRIGYKATAFRENSMPPVPTL